MEKKSTGRKLLSLMTTVAIVVGVVFMFQGINGGFSLFGNGGSDVDNNQLAAPQNLRFDSETFTLTWDRVENASGYILLYSGKEIELGTEPSYTLFLNNTENTFQIKAKGDNNPYTTSEWSAPFTYNVQLAELSVYTRVNFVLAQACAERDWELLDIIGVNLIPDDSRYIYIDMVAKNEFGKAQRFECRLKNREDSVSATLASLEAEDCNYFIRSDIVDFQSAQYLVDSGRCIGTMEELEDAGYTISVVNACTTKGEYYRRNLFYYIIGTFKAEKEGDIKYFTAVYFVAIINAQSNDDAKTNYEDALIWEDTRTLTETRSLVHDSNTLAYIEGLVAAHQ